MVDTVTLQVNLRGDATYYLCEKIKSGELKGFNYIAKNYKERKIVSYCSGIPPFGIFFNVTHQYINVTVNPSLILKRYPMADDCDTIEEACKQVVLKDIGLPELYIKSVTLNRIDYNVDFRVSTEEEKEIIYNLMSKTKDRLGKVVKTTFEGAIRYLPEAGYVEVITYDKELERIQKYTYEDYEYAEEIDKFKGVFRTEVRIKNKKLNQNKSANTWKLSKKLSNYLVEEKKIYYWKQYAEKVWYTEDFYRIDLAIEKIKQDNTLIEATKFKLIEVLKRINSSGWTKTREHYAFLKREKQIGNAENNGATKEQVNSMKLAKLTSQDYSTFNNYIKKIRELGINPLTYDKSFGIPKIPNFAKYSNNIH